MQILYISSLVSDSYFESLYKKGLTKGFSGQKYHGMFAKGLARNNDCEVTALSQPPTSSGCFRLKEEENGVSFRYVPIIAIPFIKQAFYFIYSLFYTLYWCIKNIGEKKVIISSLMRIYQYPSVRLGSLLFPCKHITVACDVPWMTGTQVSTRKPSTKLKFAIWLGKHLSSSFDGYVFLTKTMDNVLNPKHRPYIVVEGFCDYQMKDAENILEKKERKKVIMYAGGLMVKYGIQNLVDAVKLLNENEVELWLFGSGDMDEMLQQETDSRIKFFGPRSNNEVIDAELKATILINPRPTTDEYTFYSFPSKTLEYMVSGTYTMTTRLAGIPDEYFNYCGAIEDYSASGIAEALSMAIKESDADLHNKGILAKQFVLDNKNNVRQAKRILDFANQL